MLPPPNPPSGNLFQCVLQDLQKNIVDFSRDHFLQSIQDSSAIDLDIKIILDRQDTVADLSADACLRDKFTGLEYNFVLADLADRPFCDITHFYPP